VFDAIKVGLVGERALDVEQEHTAARWGSGGLLVLSTPEMIALMEGAAVAAVDHLLPADHHTVGTHVDVSHVAATPLGAKVTARAELIETDQRELTFQVQAYDNAGTIGEGTHTRFIIEEARFMQRARSRGEACPAGLAPGGAEKPTSGSHGCHPERKRGV